MYLYALYIYYIFINKVAKSNLINPNKLKPVKPCKKLEIIRLIEGLKRYKQLGVMCTSFYLLLNDFGRYKIFRNV